MKITTERLFIEPFSEKYLTGRYVSWLNDADLMKFSENRHRVHTPASCMEYFESFNGSDNCLWAITLKESGKHIGNINAYIDSHNSVADIGIMIGERSAHGKGFGLEAWQGVVDFLIKNLHIRKVTAGTMSVNQGMIKIMKRAGMVEDGTRKRQLIYDGVEVDIVHMAIFNSEKNN